MTTPQIGTGILPTLQSSRSRPQCLLRAAATRILSAGRSTHSKHAVELALDDAGIQASPLREWCVAWPADASLRKELAGSALYVTLEPSNERMG